MREATNLRAIAKWLDTEYVEDWLGFLDGDYDLTELIQERVVRPGKDGQPDPKNQSDHEHKHMMGDSVDPDISEVGPDLDESTESADKFKVGDDVRVAATYARRVGEVGTVVSVEHATTSISASRNKETTFYYLKFGPNHKAGPASRYPEEAFRLANDSNPISQDEGDGDSSRIATASNLDESIDDVGSIRRLSGLK